MNKEQFEKELDEKLTSLREEMMQKFEEENEYTFPKIEDRYWYICTDGRIKQDTWEDYDFEKDMLAINNVFPSEEAAEFERERLKVIAELKKYAEKDREWDGKEYHYYIFYDYQRNNIGYFKHSILKGGEIYFATEEKAMEAVKTVGKDRVKRFYLGVEE